MNEVDAVAYDMNAVAQIYFALREEEFIING